ncbi:MAG: phytanoyl-CoA dioxygenase [Acidiferrobacteraceae bacterium]|jgi:ectoine hydroxylase-related dioxygenase (phytanoyl-CoA dioxygenase family)|nr:phytanoyl-CoA dioxygenase [Acidiferrobacteraceae bacterium]
MEINQMSNNAAIKEEYEINGYVVVPSLFNSDEVDLLRKTTDDIIESARGKSKSDSIHDLEDSHDAAGAPKIRRIKDPVQQFDVYAALARNEKLLSIVRALLGDNVRFHNSKINIKLAEFGAAVEWHQDWAFYPHTNDAVLAVGVALEDLTKDNGPLMVVPGSHRGPVYDHHADGAFCGAIAASDVADQIKNAVPLIGPAGSITIHHVRTLHGSAINRSAQARPLLLISYTAADAWPLMGISDFHSFTNHLISGSECTAARLEAVPVRMPLPAAAFQGSIYENQRTQRDRAF